MKSAHKIIKVLFLSLFVFMVVSCGGKDERKATYFEKGKAFLEENKLDKARIEFKNVLQIDPKYKEAYFYMGLLEEKRREISKSFAYYQKAVELDPAYIEPQLKLAEIYTVIGNEEYLEKAKIILSDILAIDETNNKASLIWQQISYKEGNEEEAIKNIEMLVEEDPALEGGVILLSAAYLARNETKKALEILNKGISANESDRSLRLKKVATLFDAKMYDEAEEELIKVVDQDKGVFSSQLLLSSFYAKRNQNDKAEQALRKGVDDKPEDIKRGLVLVHFLSRVKGFDEAIAELNKMIAKQPRAYELHVNLAKLYTSSSQILKAQEIYAQIIEESDNDSDVTYAHNMLATLLIKSSDLEGAKVHLKVILDEYPRNFDALKLSSEIAIIEGDFQTAVNHLRTVLKSQPDTMVSKLLAQAHMALNEYDLAETVLKAATQADERDIAPYINYISFLISQSKLDLADAVVRDALKLNPNDIRLLELLLRVVALKNDAKEIEIVLDEMKLKHPKRSDVFLKRGQFYFVQKKYKKALTEFKHALSISEKQVDLIKSLEKISAVYISQHKVNEAITFLQKRIENNKKDISSHFVLANVYASQKNTISAEKHYRSAMNINIKWPDPHLNLSALFYRGGDVDKAIDVLKDGVEKTDDNAMLELSLAAYYSMLSQFDESKKIYESVLQKIPSNKLALNNLASILLDHSNDDGSVEKALAYAKKLRPASNPAFIDTLAWSYAKSGNYQKSIDLLNPIVEKSNKSLIFQYHLGYSLYHKGDKEEAKVYLETAANSDKPFAGIEYAKKLLSTY